MKLIPILRKKSAVEILYQMLEERTPEQSISHKKMPTMEDHQKFVFSKPYFLWDFIVDNDEIVGNIYLTNNREIGIHIFELHRGKGYATEAIKQLMEMVPGKFFANINPKNKASIKLFEALGAKHIQETYKL